MKKLYEDYIFLVRTALEGSRADDFDGDFEALLGIAREHNMTNILWYALRKNRSVPTHIVTELQSSHNMLLFKCANQKMTRGELEGLLSSAGIKHMFLKGADVAQLYPSEDMREMADIDVYADLDSHENVKEVLYGRATASRGIRGTTMFFTATRLSRSRCMNPCSTSSVRRDLTRILRRRGSSLKAAASNTASTRATTTSSSWDTSSDIFIRAASESDFSRIWRSI